MNMIIALIAPFYLFFFLPSTALRETKKPSLFLILHMSYQRVFNVIDRRQRPKRKTNKEYDQTRSGFYIRCTSQ